VVTEKITCECRWECLGETSDTGACKYCCHFLQVPGGGAGRHQRLSHLDKIIKLPDLSQAWFCIPIISALRRLSLVSLRTAWAT
jgi:hypothetical protein